MFIDLKRESRKLGLTMNVSKTEALTNPSEDLIIVPIEYIKDYTYLSQQILTNNIKEIGMKIGKMHRNATGGGKRNHDEQSNQDVCQIKTVQYLRATNSNLWLTKLGSPKRKAKN